MASTDNIPVRIIAGRHAGKTGKRSPWILNTHDDLHGPCVFYHPVILDGDDTELVWLKRDAMEDLPS